MPSALKHIILLPVLIPGRILVYLGSAEVKCQKRTCNADRGRLYAVVIRALNLHYCSTYVVFVNNLSVALFSVISSDLVTGPSAELL